MPSSDPFRPSPLRRTTSRTRTAPVPISPEAIFIYGVPDPFAELYAGPVDAGRFPPENPELPFARLNYPITQQALQVYAFDPSEGRAEVIARKFGPSVNVIVDLGKSCEIARIELYGNLLLPPLDDPSGPLFNFGLPRAVGVAVAEMPHLRVDLHGVPNLEAWLEPRLQPFHSRYEARDLRALWGWTPLHLPPTYGRFLFLHFSDLPLVCQHAKGRPLGRGLDIQRLVIYPYQEDVDHYPVIESGLISTRQTRYPVPAESAYWNALNFGAPAPETHQSVTVFADHLPWPSAFSWIPAQDSQPEWNYQSDLVELDSDDRIVLTFQATTDEIPIVEALRFYRFGRDDDKKDLPGVAADRDLRYSIEIYVTNDEEAAWSPDTTHPSWRLVETGFSIAAATDLFSVDFAEPVRARYVRALFAITRRNGADPELEYGRLRLSGAALGRCRDFVLAPECDEDLQVETVLLRVRGKSLTDDYAFINGADGLAVTIEARIAGGPFQEIRPFRNLLDMVENSSARIISNARVPDKPVQLYKEHVASSQSGTSRTDTTDSETTSDSRLPAGQQNVTVSRTGSTTMHVKNASNKLSALGDPGLAVFPNRNTQGVTTKRIYELAPNSLPDPSAITDPASMLQFISGVINDATNSPIPLNLGVGVSGSGSIQAVAGASAGVSISIGASIGGGDTLAVVRGDQASVGESQTTTLFSQSHQVTSSTGYAVQTRSGDTVEDRTVRREDQSQEVRKTGLSVRYGGKYEDVILISVPVRRLLSGRSYEQSAADKPGVTGDVLRVRIDHLPDGVKLDVEFRGSVLPRRED